MLKVSGAKLKIEAIYVVLTANFMHYISVNKLYICFTVKC